jgi:acyl carrier protein
MGLSVPENSYLCRQTGRNMKIEDFIARIEEEYEDIVPGTIKPDSIFREVFEWSSINALILIALVKTEYDVTINAEDIAGSVTVEDLYKIVLSRVQ